MNPLLNVNGLLALIGVCLLFFIAKIAPQVSEVCITLLLGCSCMALRQNSLLMIAEDSNETLT